MGPVAASAGSQAGAATEAPAAEAPAVEARGLAFRYGRGGGARGIRPLDLRVEAGAVLGVLGPNGAGKSTVLRLLATLLPPAAGELRLLGVDTRGARPALRRRIGYAGDEPVHFPHLSGRDNAVFFARAAGMHRDRARTAVAPLLERFGLASDADRRAHEYSYGMRRKLLLCEALAADPALVLLDEPTLGLDPAARAALVTELRSRAEAGAAIVLATNDLPATQQLCTRLLFLNEGRVVADGSPRTLLAALGAETWIEFTLVAERPPTLGLTGIRVVEATTERLRIRSAAGSAALAPLCDTLLGQGCAIRAIRIREPDLSDVFRAATGLDWSPRASTGGA